MANLSIRNIDPAIKEGLRARAARNGRSMEEEARRILSETIRRGRPDTDLATAIRRHVEPLGGVDLEPHPDEPVAAPPRFE